VLQTETFDAIMKDDALRTMLQDAEIARSCSDADAAAALQDEASAGAEGSALAREARRSRAEAALERTGMRKKFDDANMRALCSNQAFAEALRSDDFRDC
jgi:hypothetical protein